MRRLIYVPIVHSEADFGSLSHTMRKRYTDRLGLSGWRSHIRSIDALWDEIRRRVLALELDFYKLKVYQDGLPVCGRELEIVRDLAQQGSKNHLLLMELAERGATIMGTEDAHLLVEEYLRLRNGLEEGGRLISGEELLSRRDLYIAKRISQTLCQGEIGILFIGLLHNVDEGLGQDIDIRYLLREREEARED